MTGVMPYRALVLAGQRSEGDPVALARSVPAKALAPVAGRIMVLRVLDALRDSGVVDGVILCGPGEELLSTSAELVSRLAQQQVQWIPPRASPSLSAAAGLEQVPGDVPVLVTTADHALLSGAMVRHFVQEAAAQGTDAVVGLVRHEIVSAAYPGTRRTVTRFRDAGYCGCNLYALNSPAGHSLVSLWRRVEESRKKPWRVLAGLLGPAAILDYAMGRLSLEDALERLSRRLGLKAGAVILPFPEAGIDVDSEADLELAERILGRSTA